MESDPFPKSNSLKLISMSSVSYGIEFFIETTADDSPEPQQSIMEESRKAAFVNVGKYLNGVCGYISKLSDDEDKPYECMTGIVKGGLCSATQRSKSLPNAQK